MWNRICRILVSVFVCAMPAFAERVAEFTVSPDPSPGVPITFDGSPSICPVTPCSYKWMDDADNSVLGTGVTFSFIFQQTGTKRVHLTITDAKGQTASIQHDVVVMAMTPARWAIAIWGADGRTGVLDGDTFCVGKQEYQPATIVAPFGFGGSIPNPNAGKPIVSPTGMPQPAWLGCGPSWQAAFSAAGHPMP